MSEFTALEDQLQAAEAELAAAERGTPEHRQAMDNVFTARRALRLAQEDAGVRNGLVAVQED